MSTGTRAVDVAQVPVAPVRVAGLVTAAYALALTLWLVLPWPLGTHDAAGWTMTAGLAATRVVVALLLLRAVRSWRPVVGGTGLGDRPTGRGLRLAAPLLVLPALPGLFGPGLAHAPAWRFAAATLVVATVAFGEEVVFRGAVLRVLLTRGVRSAVLGSSALFGLMHVVNLVAGDDPVTVTGQVLMAAGLGVAFAAVTLASGSLWPAIALHLLLDLVNAVQAAVPTTAHAAATAAQARSAAPTATADLWVAAAVNVALGAVAAGYGWWVLRRTVLVSTVLTSEERSTRTGR